jgi:hypothetical protein
VIDFSVVAFWVPPISRYYPLLPISISSHHQNKFPVHNTPPRLNPGPSPRTLTLPRSLTTPCPGSHGAPTVLQRNVLQLDLQQQHPVLPPRHPHTPSPRTNTPLPSPRPPRARTRNGSREHVRLPRQVHPHWSERVRQVVFPAPVYPRRVEGAE